MTIGMGYGVSTILIWDLDGIPPSDTHTSVLWCSYDTASRDNLVSIPQLVEDNADSLKSRYLAWIYELGETNLKDKRIVDHFELRTDFSYWWMTLFVGKCNYSKSKQIDDAIRLMAFFDWAANKSISHVLFVSSNLQLAKCLSLGCAAMGIAFEWEVINKPPERRSLLNLTYHALPQTFQALIWLLHYLIERWPLREVGLKEWQQSDGEITFFSYSDNWVPDLAKQGRYESRYWGNLPESLQYEVCKTNWLHLYVKDDLLPTAKHAAVMIRDFNKNALGLQHHVTLDTFLNWGVVFNTLYDWLRLLWIGINVSGPITYNVPSCGIDKTFNKSNQAPVNLWPLFENDWKQSIFGTVAIANLLNLNLFEAALKRLPKQQVGIYLQENQGWEFGLIHAWQSAGHNRLIGSPHSTIRYWDLRYFFDQRSYLKTGGHDLPLPSRVACNGPAATDAYVRSGYPKDDLIEVEALRYLYIREASRNSNADKKSPHGSIRILVLGDYLFINTQRQMNLLLQAVPLLPSDAVIIVKPHPNCPIYPADYPKIKMVVTMEPISKLLDECDVAYSSAVTSAAVDAYCTGVPVVSVLDPNILNQSPLRGYEGALFASTSDELAAALVFAASNYNVQDNQQVLFTIDYQLPRWRKLLLG